MELTQKERFRLVMIPALMMGVLTNVYIASLMLIHHIWLPLISPVVSGLLFSLLFQLVRKERLSAKKAFLFGAYLVIFEVTFHTFIFGWETGFIFFMFLLPIVFILDSSWILSTTIAFLSSVIISAFVLALLSVGKDGFYIIGELWTDIIYVLNLIMVAVVVVVVMLFFSRTLNSQDEALRNANRDLAIQNKEILKQHEQLQVLVKEIHHRVKNNLQIISSLMSLQKNTVSDERLIQVLNESKMRVEAIALIHQKLYQDDKVNYVDFHSYLEELLEMQKRLGSEVDCELEASTAILNLDVAVPLGLVLSELITNAMKHGLKDKEDPKLKVLLEEEHGHYHLRVKDNGVGLPDDFSLENPTSFGSEIIVALTNQIDADIAYKNDHGACFDIKFVA